MMENSNAVNPGHEKFFGACICMKGESLKILQFADLHFGINTRPYHNGKEEETCAYMRYLVESAKPDLIIASGDNILDTGTEGLKKFIDLMEGYAVPWTYIFGNHDSESHEGKEKLHRFLLESKKDAKYLVYEEGYTDPQNGRYGNFFIRVYASGEEETLCGAILLMDSGIYNYEEKYYECITEDQVRWYQNAVDCLQKEYAYPGVIPTLLFSHIQLPQYRDAYLKASRKEDGATFVIGQTLSEAEIEEIASGAGKTDSGLLEAIVEKKSTRAFLCGHAHVYDFQILYRGVLLGFGPQTGFSNGFKDDDKPRKTYLYTIDQEFHLSTTALCEPRNIFEEKKNEKCF